MHGELKFFEIGVADTSRARTFYGSLFDWQFEPGPSGNGFEIATPNMRGGMHGGDAGATPYVFFEVEDMEAALDRVRELGGDVEEMDVEGDEENIARFGRFKLCRDDQGSHFGLHQPPTRSQETSGEGAMSTSYKPNNYNAVSPYLIVDGANDTIDFLKSVFGAIELRRFPDVDGKLMHSEVRIEDTVVMIADGGEGWSPVHSYVHIYVTDVDATYRRALEAGATSVQEPVKKEDEDKRGGVKDAGGTTWWISTKVE